MQTLKFDPKDPVVIVSVRIKASFATIGRFVLDTGASYIVLPWKMTTAIGILIDPKNTIQTTTATAVETVPKINIPEVTFLGKTVRNVKAIVKDLPPETTADGLLGLSFLKNFKLTIDFKKGYLGLE